eukprot:8777823-Alexandrium_andersonii.AAC.1
MLAIPMPCPLQLRRAVAWLCFVLLVCRAPSRCLPGRQLESGLLGRAGFVRTVPGLSALPAHGAHSACLNCGGAGVPGHPQLPQLLALLGPSRGLAERMGPPLSLPRTGRGAGVRARV